MGRKIKDWACHFLIQITPAHCTAFSKAIFWLTVCVIYVWTWTEMWLIVFRWKRFTVCRGETDVGCDSGMLASGGVRIPVETIGMRSEARQTNGIKVWYAGKRRQIERFGSPFIAWASPSAWFIHLSLLVLEAWTLTLLIPSQIQSYWNHMWAFL